MKMIKYVILFVLVFSAGANLCCLMIDHHSFARRTLLLQLLLFFVVMKNNRWTYRIALLLCVYGLYNCFYIEPKAAVPTHMQFTAPVKDLFFGSRNGGRWGHMIRLIPLLFYVGYPLLLISRKGREYYGVSLVDKKI
ncbi:hypothetical protein [Chitinophaga varians]|uniref:hypothetical protein n=1 Tax=Chitinophaga varians TaxID=2202339 RepID=UPI00165EE7F7|nr:hypothetical protein [Chitinophaga varians]MBC9915544.1 hypothetical protein [Chitinophaga varians]